MKLSTISPLPKPERRLIRQTRVSNAMDAAFRAEIQKHGLSRTKALLMLVEQYNANPWPLDTNSPRHGDLFYTWAAFPAPIGLADTFAAHCAAADLSTGEGLRQVVQRCLDTASGKAAWDGMAGLLGPNANLVRREGLPTMRDLREALADERVCLHLLEGSSETMTILSKADFFEKDSCEFAVQWLEQRDDAHGIPELSPKEPWMSMAWAIHIHRLATARLGEGRPAEPSRQGAYKAPIL